MPLYTPILELMAGRVEELTLQLPRCRLASLAVHWPLRYQGKKPSLRGKAEMAIYHQLWSRY
jgi:hypothetical protein